MKVTSTIQNDIKKAYMTPKIGVSASADGSFLNQEACEMGKSLGKEIVDQGAILVTGASTGFPYWSAMGAKQAGGLSIGFSPAVSPKEHTDVYRLPLDYMDLISFTGFGYPGRDLIFTRSCDGIIIGPGRIGTIHEFTIAFEGETPMGILESDLWETDEIIRIIIEKSHRINKYIVFDKDPRTLVTKVLNMVREKKALDYPENLKK
ncbi:MAG: hypothetical protein RJB39_684 [Candidatus Parcubacteria bacterium]|jgi:uncharacterized protein (TIGR00725 family)